MIGTTRRETGIIERPTMPAITVTLRHEFGNGESSETSTTIGALGPSEAAALEQLFMTQVTQTLLRIGRHNATQRDPGFPAILAAVAEIAGKGA